MTTVKKKNVRISSSGSDSDDKDQGNPKTHENGDNGGKKRILGDNKADDSENVVKSNTCFVCDGKDNWVLVCHGEECPLAIHQSCTSDEPDFDEFGNFYCPYCWYKHVVAKSAKLQKKFMVTDKSKKGSETLEGVKLGLMMDEVSDDKVEVNVSGGRSISSGNPSGNRRKGESYEEFIVMEKNQRMKEVATETSDACFPSSNGGRKGRAECSEINHEKVQVCNSDVGEERKQHETAAQAHSFDAGVKTRKQRVDSEKSQKLKRVARTHKRGVCINDEGTQASDSDLGEGRSGQGFYDDDNNQQKKASSSESCGEEVPKTDNRVSNGSGLGEGRHLKKKQYLKAIETGTQEKKISKDGERKREKAVERDVDDFNLANNQERQCQADMRNDDAAFSEQDEQVERNSSISSPMSVDNVKDSDAASQQLAMIIHPKAYLLERPTEAQPIEAQPYRSVSSKKPSFQPETYKHKSYMENKGAVSNDPGQRKDIASSGVKRKRLFWTPAEEEMLRVGVEKFPGFRNVPWRKILEYGRDVFQEERLPSDLKDKWKKMKKMSSDSDTGKWVSLPTERQPDQSLSE